MKRRNAECGKMRRPVKRNKITDGIYGSTVLYLKFLLLWALVILADFILEFRFEFLWPFWMLLRSVYDSFKYQGLAFSVFFVCIALTSDMICFFFIPVQWVFFAASTYVWVQYVWHTDKGICLPTVILCSVFVYMEGGVRLRDLRHMPAHVDLCRPFAAHCIGYPVVTLGFGLKTFVGHRIRIRRQKQVAKENAFYMQLLQEALPPSAHIPSAIKDSADKNSTLAIEKVPETTSVTNNVPDKQQHMNGNAVHHNNNINNHSSHNSNSSSKSNHIKKADVSRNTSQSAGVSSNHQISGGGDTSSASITDNVVPSQTSGGKPSQSYNCNNINTSSLTTSSGKQHAHTNGVATHAATHSDLHQIHQATESDAAPPDKNVKGSKSNASKHEKKETTNTPREESRKKNKNKDKENNRETNSKDRDRDTARERDKEIKETTNLQKDIIKENNQKDKDSSVCKEKESQKDKDINREKDGETQKDSAKETHREKEKESKKDKDRDKEKEELHQKHMEHKENCERQLRQLRAEITQLRSQNEQLNARVNAARSAERAAISSVERRVSEERRRAEGCRQRRAALETEVASLRQQLHQARERGQRLERDLQTAEHQVSTMESKMRENGPEAWRTAFNTLRDKAQQLERSLSAETRIKMDLFSAVGEAKRLSGLREGVIRSQEKEIEELKGKIAQMLAVMPSDPFPQPYHMQVPHPHPHHHPLPSPPAGNPLSNLDPNATAYTPKSVNQTTIKG